MDIRPPKNAFKLLEWWCSSYYFEEVSGDMEEEYFQWHEQMGERKANRMMWWTVLRSLRPYLRKNPSSLFENRSSNHIDMIRNYFKIAVRAIMAHKTYTTINVFSLSIGLAACMLISLFVAHEVSYDKFHVQVEDVYRVNVDYNWGGDEGSMIMTPTALLPTIQNNFPEVEAGVRVFRVGMFSPLIVGREKRKFEEPGFLYVDSAFFDVFSFKLLSGNPKTALTEPRSIVLSETSAKKYFPDEDPMGQTLDVGNNTQFKVTGIVQDVPDNSHLTFDMLGSFSSTSASRREIWGSANYVTYLRLNTNDVGLLQADLTAYVTALLKDNFEPGDKLSYHFEPIADIHLQSRIDRELEPQGNIDTLYVIVAVGLLILIIACVNYMNLATARSMDRAKEVGMRKTLGASQNQLFGQFMGESGLITSIGFVLAFVWVNFSLPLFNNLTAKRFEIVDLLEPTFLMSAVLVVVIVALLSGAYPALVLSRFRPHEVLKGVLRNTLAGATLRKYLVVFQFFVSILLILGTIIVYDQLNFMSNKKLGYDKESVLIVPIDYSMRKDHEKIKDQMLRNKDVVNASYGSDSPVQIMGGYGIEIPELGADASVGIRAVTVDPDFIKTMGMELVAGRDYSEADFQQSTVTPDSLRWYSFIVNEALLEKLYLTPDKAVGLQASIGNRQGEIRAVVKNFHFASLHEKIEPMAMFLEPSQYNHLLLRLSTNDIPNTLMALQQQWEGMIFHRPFVYQFADQEYDALYRNEHKVAKLFTIFSVLAITIACLGLFGLISFSAVKRAKEIGIRKVMGASVPRLVLLLSRDYSILVVIAFALAAPIGYMMMNNWLQSFEYKVDVGVFPFLVAIIIAFSITMLTIGYQSVKSALANPAETLKNNE